jgi:FKBP-type peptidyl-prolyl cis-trans isomerase
MQKQIVALSVTTLVLLTAIICIGYFYAVDSLDKDKKKVAQVAVNQPKAETTKDLASPGVQLPEVQSAQTTNTNQTNKFPEPEGYSVYEQFSTAQSTQYIDLVFGDGAEAQVGSNVTVFYSGWLTNGQLFDQSPVNEDNLIEPIVFKIGDGRVIPGWEQGITGMKVGGRRRLIIPSQFGYGQTGAGEGAIPPNAMLIFDIQLVQVEEQP